MHINLHQDITKISALGSSGVSHSAAPIPLRTQMFLEMLSGHAVLKLYAIYIH